METHAQATIAETPVQHPWLHSSAHDHECEVNLRRISYYKCGAWAIQNVHSFELHGPAAVAIEHASCVT